MRVVRVITMEGDPNRIQEILLNSFLRREGEYKDPGGCTFTEVIRVVEQEEPDGMGREEK